MVNQASDALRRMLVARQNVARRTPFFSHLVFNAKLEQSDRRPAIWTNGISIFFNPEYVKANDPYIEGDFLECVMKCALLHIPRRKARNEQKWGAASHLSVRPIVHQYFRQHPELEKGDGLYPNKAVEEIFELLPDEVGDFPQPNDEEGEEGDDEQQGGGGGEGDNEEEGEGNSPPGGDPADQPGGMEDPTPEQQEEAEQAAKDWQRATQNAKDKAQKAGNMPANILRLVEELLPTEKLNWHDLIRDMSFDAKSMNGRTWSRVNRRRQDPIMPGYENDVVYRLICIFDVSGSIDVDTQFKAMKTEIANGLDQGIFTEAVLIAVDTAPKYDQIEVANCAEDVRNWHPRGGGGTNFQSVMEYVNREYPNAIGAVFLTDLETNDFGRAPPYPMVWINFGSNKRLKAPYGRTTDYNVD